MSKRSAVIAAACAVAIIAGGLVVAGRLTPQTGSPTAAPTADSLQRDVAALVDENGLVVNPTASADTTLDFYSSALLLSTASSLHLSTGTLRLAGVTRAQVSASTKRLATPSAWLDWSMTTIDHAASSTALARLSAASTSRHANAVPTRTGDASSDATDLWLASTAFAETNSTGDPADLIASIGAVATAAPTSPYVAWRLTQACDELATACPAFSHLRLTPDLSTPSGVLDAWAAAELVARGTPVEGFVGKTVAQAAQNTFADVTPGNDLVATALGRIAFLGGRGTSNFATYLASQSHRRDATTGLYRVAVHEQGTVDNTYVAMRFLGERFAGVARPSTDSTLQAFLADPSNSSVLSRLHAIAVRKALGQDPSSAERAEITTAAAGIQADLDRHLYPNALQTIDVVRFLGGRLPALTAQPLIVDADSERTVDALLAQAGDKTFANSAALLDYYSGYLSKLVPTTIGEGTASPLFLDRLSIYYLAPGELTSDQASRLADDLRSLRGCKGESQLYRVGEAADAPCELGRTLLATQSGILELDVGSR